MLTLSQLRTRLGQVPVWAWVAAVAVGGAGLLVWHEWANTRGEGEQWLDPEQPPPNIDAAAALLPADRARRRPYPSSLIGMPECPAGDC